MPASAAAPVASASRVDSAQGIREEVGFFDVGRGRLFGSIHSPVERTGKGVLLCCPVGAEFDKNYRREVLIGRELAASGVAVARFHYLGTGQSEGEPSTVTMDSMLADARGFADLFAEKERIERLAVLGTRLGGMVAAAFAARLPGAPLALWQPTIDGDRYFQEVFRARFMAELRKGGGSPPSRETLVEEMRRQGWVDVVGYTITPAFYESVVGARLDDVAGTEARPALIVQLGPNRLAEQQYEALVRRWRELGWDAELRMVDEKEAWWFGEQRRGLTAVIDVTRDYLVAALAEGEGS